MLQIFNEIDANQNGVLEVSEIMAKFREKGYQDIEIDAFLAECDLDNNGTVSLDEFLAVFSRFIAKSRFASSAGRT